MNAIKGIEGPAGAPLAPSEFIFRKRLGGAYVSIKVEAAPLDSKVWADALLMGNATARAHVGVREFCAKSHYGVALLGPRGELVGWIAEPKHWSRDEAVAAYQQVSR